MKCDWCDRVVPRRSVRIDSRFCSKLCRQTAFRLRKRRPSTSTNDTPLTFAYADPPYPGKSARYYKHEPTFAGEVDHAALVSLLEERRLGGELAGYAISTGAYALRELLPLLPAHPLTRVCPWVKPGGVPPATKGLHNMWEALLVVGGRQEPPGRRDWFEAHPARHGGTLMGRKPIAFCVFLFDALGMRPGDVLDDLYPGTGVVSRAWRQLCREALLPGALEGQLELGATGR